jgi:septation ring formation regulator EzrA
MGAIKYLADLVAQLSKRSEDRVSAAELRQIQGMIGDIRSEQAALNEKIIELMTENAGNKKHISSLERQVLELKRPTASSDEEFPGLAQKILLVLTKCDKVTAEQMANHISVDPVKVKYWLEKLSDSKHVAASYVTGTPTKYFLAQRGREYLITKELI